MQRKGAVLQNIFVHFHLLNSSEAMATPTSQVRSMHLLWVHYGLEGQWQISGWNIALESVFVLWSCSTMDLIYFNILDAEKLYHSVRIFIYTGCKKFHIQTLRVCRGDKMKPFSCVTNIWQVLHFLARGPWRVSPPQIIRLAMGLIIRPPDGSGSDPLLMVVVCSQITAEDGE